MPQRTLAEREFNAIRDRLLAEAPAGLDEAGFQRWIGPRLASAVGEAESLPAKAEGSALGRFGSNVGEMLNPIAMAKGIGQAIQHPIDTASNILGQSANQARQAVDMAKQGRYSEALGHGIGTLPLIGPAAVEAGEQIAQGDIAGGLGKGVGMLIPAAIPSMVRGARAAAPGRAREAVAVALDKGAADRYAGVMRPEVGQNKTRFGNTAERIAPELASDPNMSAWSREGLHRNVQQSLEASTRGLDEASDARLSARSFPTQPIINDLIQKRARFTAEAEKASSATRQTSTRASSILDERGQPIAVTESKALPYGTDQVPAPNRARVAQIDQAIAELKGLGPSARYESLRRIRESYDGPAKTVYNPSMTADFLTKKGESLGAADVTGSLREMLAKADPGTAQANAAYSLSKAADDVLTATAEVERTRPKVGRRIMARFTTTTAGATSAGFEGAVAGFVLGPALDSALSSGFTTQLKTAQMMSKLARAIQRGDEGAVITLTSQLKRLSAQGATLQGRQEATSPSGFQMQPAGAR